ncbi:quinoprotein glucose dehydrogenase [Paenibacillus sp. 1011MAR3C5]|uniref:PQQ-dependent sugar dehydrogenase n=1 Tax=Paenibacillus sp. 1011MAR3C5 TaxID=1675787 RepID=UPI000E6D16FC|nr:PQQ-dependent sugar dehydrogenase [Paenibacillus sp. 1011MAR3C5]RJE88649.1 quinoprotein glucose dehydrogenase [Paenibacillus sp. 1011MAR3C5]
MNTQWIKLGAAAMTLAIVIAGCSRSDAPSEENGPSPSAAAEQPSSGDSNGEKPAPSEPAGEPSSPAAYNGTVSAGLRIPWSIAFHGNEIYLSEREGNIVHIKDSDIDRQTVRLGKAVHHDGEGGFLGLLLAPDFQESGLAYAYHTYRGPGGTLNRVVLLKKEGSEWAEERALLEDIPGDLYHNGGRMAYGPDGMLYVTTGDAQEQALSQNRDSLAGKILRMTLDGAVPEDNPIPGSYVYSYGHRNPQGLAWTEDGVMYSTEHGPSGRPGGHDEINRIEPTGNYGWPVVIGDDNRDGMIAPLYHTGDEAIAPSGTIIDDQGRLLIAGLRGEAIYRYTPESGELETLHEGEGRIRDLVLRDGTLYFITNNRDGRGAPSSTDDRLIAIPYE